MATGAVHGDIASFIASETFGAHLPANLGTANNTVDVAAAATDRVIGFSDARGAASGAPVAIQTKGRCLALVGVGDWTKGAKLTPSTAGTLIVTTTAGDLVCAIAQEAAVATEYAEIEIIDPVRYDSFA